MAGKRRCLWGSGKNIKYHWVQLSLFFLESSVFKIVQYLKTNSGARWKDSSPRVIIYKFIRLQESYLLSLCLICKMRMIIIILSHKVVKMTELAVAGMACDPKDHWFNSQLGHMPGFQAGSPVGGMWEATNGCFSNKWMFLYLFSPSLPLSLKINK